MNDYEKKMLGKVIGMVGRMEIKGISIALAT